MWFVLLKVYEFVIKGCIQQRQSKLVLVGITLIINGIMSIDTHQCPSNSKDDDGEEEEEEEDDDDDYGVVDDSCGNKE